MVVIVIIMVSMGACSYLAFGEPVDDIILQNLQVIYDTDPYTEPYLTRVCGPVVSLEGEVVASHHPG